MSQQPGIIPGVGPAFRSGDQEFIGIVVTDPEPQMPIRPPDREGGVQTAPPVVYAVRGYACIVRAPRQQGIANRDEFGSMAARQQPLQKQERLLLPSAKVRAEVDDERAHAQASPGLGQERRVSVSPARRRPSLRYLR